MGSRARIELRDLNDMHNHPCEQIDTGVKILLANNGKDVTLGPLPKLFDGKPNVPRYSKLLTLDGLARQAVRFRGNSANDNPT